MLVLVKICYWSTFSHCSNILIEILCNDVQNFTLVNAHKPKFGPFFFLLKPFQISSCSFSFFFLSSFLFTLHILPFGRRSLDKIIGKPWKGDVDHFRECWPVYAPNLHQKWSVFFSISSVRMQSIYKMHSPLERTILALSVAYLKNWLTCILMTSQVVQWLLLQMLTKVDFGTKRVKPAEICSSFLLFFMLSGFLALP